MDNSEPLSICTFCLNSAFLRLIRLSFSPTLPSALHYYLPALFFAFRGQLVATAGFGTYLVASGCTYGFGTVFSTPSACRSLSMPFRFDTRTGLRPGCCTSSVISTNAFAYLPGLSLYVPRRLWKVQDSNLRCPRFQDVTLRWVTLLCLRPLGQPSKYIYPES